MSRSLDGQLAGILHTASSRAASSLQIANILLKNDMAGPAYVWAVRSIEILMKEFMLLPLFLEEFDGEWSPAWKKAKNAFGSSNWSRAMQLVDQQYGPLEEMLTDEDENAWDVWKSKVIRRRGEIVHGVDDSSSDEAEVVVQWAEQMAIQLKLRLIVAGKHPFHDIFRSILEEGRKAFEDEQKQRRST